jgi:hypothetical protein
MERDSARHVFLLRFVSSEWNSQSDVAKTFVEQQNRSAVLGQNRESNARFAATNNTPAADVQNRYFAYRISRAPNQPPHTMISKEDTQ